MYSPHGHTYPYANRAQVPTELLRLGSRETFEGKSIFNERQFLIVSKEHTR